MVYEGSDGRRDFLNAEGSHILVSSLRIFKHVAEG